MLAIQRPRQRAALSRVRNHSSFFEVLKYTNSFRFSFGFATILGVPPNTTDEFIFHSGVTVNQAGQYLTNGGRVLLAVALREDLRQAAADATKMCQGITFSGAGAQFRTDIAEKAFKM